MKLLRYVLSIFASAMFFVVSTTAFASLQSQTWPASDEAKQFVKDTVVIGFLASPYFE